MSRSLDTFDTKCDQFNLFSRSLSLTNGTMRSTNVRPIPELLPYSGHASKATMFKCSRSFSTLFCLPFKCLAGLGVGPASKSPQKRAKLNPGFGIMGENW